MSGDEVDIIHPRIHGTVKFDIEEPWPHVDLTLPNGRRVVGYVVADHLRDRLPTHFDSLNAWSNPYAKPQHQLQENTDD